MPVAAGKKTAKTAQKSVPANPFSGEPRQVPAHWMSPVHPAGLARIRTRDSAITAMIPYWTRNVSSALR